MNSRRLIYLILIVMTIGVTSCGAFGGKTKKKCIPCQQSSSLISADYQTMARMS